MATVAAVQPRAFGPQQAARARWATVRIETDKAVYVGRMFVPETKRRVSDVLSDERMFINLTEVQVDDSTEVEPFIAINKGYVRTLRILHEGDAEPRGGRFS